MAWPPAVVPRLIGWVVDGPQDSVAAAAALLVAERRLAPSNRTARASR